MSHRLERVAKLIREELSELLQRQVKDPRLGEFLAITDVSVSPDLKYARVFVSRIGTEEEKQELLAVLSSASGFLRRELTRRLNLRSIPELSFHWDDSIERGDRILHIIDEINAQKKD